MNTAAQTKSNTTDRPFHCQKQHLKNSGIDMPMDEDQPRRRSASNYAAAFNALTTISGIKPDFWNGFHILLDKMRGASSGKWIYCPDTEAGTLLPGDDDVSDDAKAKRWKRFWDGYDGKQNGASVHYDGFEDEQKRLGKRIAYREAGKAEKQTKFDQPRLIPSRYRSFLPQMIVDVVRRAGELKDKRIRGKKLTRKERFEEAAKAVWNLLPDYDDISKVKIKNDMKPSMRSTKNQKSRYLNRILKATKEMIESANSQEEIEHLRMQLHAEIETLFADAITVENEPENEPNEGEIPQNRATFSEKICKNIEQNERFSENRGDNIVHPVPDFEADEIPLEFAAPGVIYISPDRKEVII